MGWEGGLGCLGKSHTFCHWLFYHFHSLFPLLEMGKVLFKVFQNRWDPDDGRSSCPPSSAPTQDPLTAVAFPASLLTEESPQERFLSEEGPQEKNTCFFSACTVNRTSLSASAVGAQ